MVWELEVHILQVIGLVFVVELLPESDKEIVVFDWVSDGGKLIRDLSPLE